VLIPPGCVVAIVGLIFLTIFKGINTAVVAYKSGIKEGICEAYIVIRDLHNSIKKYVLNE
jgi:hypothetical protein